MKIRLTRPPGSISLNCMDRTNLAHHLANEPMLLHAIIDIEGEADIDTVRLNQAIISAQNTFPIMRSILKRKYLWPYREIKKDIGPEVLTTQDLTRIPNVKYEDYLFEWMNQPLDMGKSFPLRVLLIKKNEFKSVLVFTCNHSSTDALRGCLFMRKVIETYNSGVFHNPEALQDIRISRHRDELIEHAQSQRQRTDHFYMKILYGIFHRWVLPAVPFPARIFNKKKGCSRKINLLNKMIAPNEFKELELKATSAGVEVNDIFMASAHRLVEKWNNMHGKVSRKISVMIPINFSPKGFSQVLCNQLSWLSIPSWPKDRCDKVTLLKNLRSELIHQSMTRRYFDILYSYYMFTRLPMFIMVILLKLFLSTGIITRALADSILFTNIGVVWPQVGSEKPAITHLGSSKIVNFTGSGFVMTPLKMGLGASIYNKTMNISLTYRPAMFSRDEAQQFLDLFVEEALNYQVS